MSTSWADGYISDIEYSSHYYRELSPTHLNFAVLGQGIRPRSTGVGSTYCELGCGQGLSSIVVAATHPHVKVWGFDFNPAHIGNAQRLAAEAKLENVTFADYSFEQLVSLPTGTLPPFDYIVLHGIYSWISPENRRHIVTFIDRYIKPGGLVYVSYNCQPGWSVTAPLQRLIREHALRAPDRSDRQVEAALDFTKKLIDGQAGYFVQNPVVGKRLERLPTTDKHYLAHEYLNGHWNPLFHLDVAREMQAARLTYAASATLLENIDRMSIPSTMLPLLEETKDPGWRETLRDFARNQQFRRDIFVRGASHMLPAEQSQMIASIKLALMSSSEVVKPTVETSFGTITPDKTTYVPILDALTQRPHTIGELAALPGLSDKSRAAVLLAINLLVHPGYCNPVQEDWKLAASTSRSLNRTFARRLGLGDTVGYAALPATGTAIRATFVELALLGALQAGVAPDGQKVAEFIWSLMERTGRRLIKDSQSLESKQENLALLRSQLSPLLEKSLPVWRSLGAV